MKKKEGRSPTKRKAPVEPTVKPSAKKVNLRLSNSFKSALCTQLMKYDKEADNFVDKILKAPLDEASDEDSLKEKVRSTQVVHQWIKYT